MVLSELWTVWCVFCSLFLPCDTVSPSCWLLIWFRCVEDLTILFLMLANATSYPDDPLCAFYDASLNTASRALSSEDGPREDFAAFVEWTLARNGSPLTISPGDDLIRSTPEPRAQPTISPWCGASARAHRWWRAISCRDPWASTKPSNWAEDRLGCWPGQTRPD